MAEAKPQEKLTTSKEDVEKNKSMAIIAWFIFFIPLLTDAKDSKFAKFHANQSLLVVGLYVVIAIVSAVLTPILLFTPLFFVPTLLWLLPFVFWIMGLISAINGEMKRLPLIGGIDIIK